MGCNKRLAGDALGLNKLFRMANISSGVSKVLLGCIFGLCGYAVLLQTCYLHSHSRTQLQQQQQHATPAKRRHDPFSKFSIMWKYGKLYNEQQPQEPPQHSASGLVFDTLSIGTQKNLGLLEAQSRTWGSHKGIRHYFAATEVDDADPNCYLTLNKTTIDNIVNTCVNDQPLAKEGFKIQYTKFSTGSANAGIPPAGWICAQQRFAVALEKLGTFYKRELAGVENFTLPDYLMMQDDDTYYNMIRIEEFLRDKDPDVPLAEAPCLIRHTKLQNFSFPWGGYGFILSRGAVQNLIRPVDCSSSKKDEFEQNVCNRLQDDLSGEARYFRNGMSVSDLMGAQVRNNLFTNYTNDGNWAYCMHGDWVVGYYVNLYYLSSHVKDPDFAGEPRVRIEGTLGMIKGGTYGNCIHGDVERCDETAHVCHRQTALSMANRTREIAASSPGTFRNFP